MTAEPIHMPEKHRSILINVFLCLLALLVGGGGFAGLASLREEPPRREIEEKLFNVEVFDVQRANLQEIIAGFGSVTAEREVVYSAQVAGEIVSVSRRLKVGERVSGPEFFPNDPVLESGSQQMEGEVLLAIDPEVYHERLTQADDAVAEAQAELHTLTQQEKNNNRLLDTSRRNFATAKDDHDRMERLAKDGTVSENQLSLSQLEMRRYERTVIEAENLLALIPVQRQQVQKRFDRLLTEKKLASIDVRRTEVRAPFSGVLTEVHVEKGQFVQPGTPLYRVTQIDSVEIAIPLHPLEFAKIAELVLAGQLPLVQLAENEVAGARWTGRVVRISPEADAATRTIDVFVEVNNAGLAVPLLPGSFVQARIDGPILRDEIVIPRSAVVGSEPGSTRVFVERNGLVVETPITVSRRLEGQAFISAGLEPGDRVVLTNLDALSDKARVEVQATVTIADTQTNGQTLIVLE
ncbi:MAG: efflux RND transporter periplasmic adaptor subunit [Planctomycetota bacterium]|nr:efflux RND transporter periplasmic adaptor subunit [Planctomycetota bacterium]